MTVGAPIAAPRPRAALMRVAVAVALLHALNDAYTAFLPPLLPRIMGELGLSITLAAGLMTALALGSSLAQPIMGRVADRRGRRAVPNDRHRPTLREPRRSPRVPNDARPRAALRTAPAEHATDADAPAAAGAVQPDQSEAGGRVEFQGRFHDQGQLPAD